MSSKSPNHQLPPTTAIAPDDALRAKTETWFEYTVKAFPHHTDYAGVVWHGTYLTWMEEARVEYLQSLGVHFADLVQMGCDLPVVEMSLRYHRPVRMGMTVSVKTRMNQLEGVRMNFDYKIESLDAAELYLSGKIVLVAVDLDKGKIMRQLPSSFKQALIKRN